MPYTREVRLGLVLYGGVSLAIYENGVAQEIYRAVRGEGVYGILKDLIDSDIVLDIISGTSAGGVNGIMLGYALANDLNFASVAKLWRDDGDIENLIRRNNDEETLSVLDSEGFYQPRLEAAIASMPKWTPGAYSSPIEELDLFVTGTNVVGRVSTVYDDQGHPIDLKDHNGVFKLAFRRGRTPPKNDFDAQGVPELAMLARLTSCFPIAFAPVTVDSSFPRLRRWSKLEQDAVFLDGGILDNKPFSYAIDAISGRTAERDVQRFIFYVEPDPERFSPQSAAKQKATVPAAPGVVSSAMDALLSIPGYESISGDLRSISDHNERVTRLEQLFKCLPDPPPVFLDSIDQTAVIGPVRTLDWCVYYKSRLMQLRDRAVEGILNETTGRGYFCDLRERRAARLLIDSFNYWENSPDEVLKDFDIYYRQRRLIHLTYVLQSQMRLNPAESQIHTEFWREINHWVKLADIIRWAMEAWMDKLDIGWRSLDRQFRDGDNNEVEPSDEQCAAISREKWAQVANGFRALLSAEGLDIPAIATQDARSSFYKSLAGRLGQPPEREPKGNLLHEFDRAVACSLKEWAVKLPNNIAVREFCRFLEVDHIVFPMQFAAGSESRDLIRVVRLSPVDAQRAFSAKPIDHKLCGRTLGAFGGFFKKPWRSNDVMWGRLDAASQIIECTLTKERLNQVWGKNSPPSSRPDLSEGRLAILFPQSTPAVHNSLANQLQNVSRLTDAQLDALTTQLVEAAQLEIAKEEWPIVLGDALDQERTWSMHRTIVDPPKSSPYNPPNLTWVAAQSTPDRTLVAVAAHAITSGNLPPFGSFQIAGRPFHEEIPRPVLLELILRVTIRVARSLTSCIQNPAVRKGVEGSMPWRLLVNWFLPIIYNWTRFQRTAPQWRISLSVFVLTASLLVLIAGIVALAFLIFHWNISSAVYFFMIFVPIVVIGIWAWAFRR